MSEKEKENVVSLISTLLVTIPYLYFIINKFRNETFSFEEELVFWATAILLMIPIRLVAQIIVYIFFTIFRAVINGDSAIEEEVSDERDRLIELRGDRNSTNTFTFGFIGALLAILAGQSLSIMFLIIIISGCIGELIGIISKIYYYHNGQTKI